jgi:hypothetical protein
MAKIDRETLREDDRSVEGEPEHEPREVQPSADTEAEYEPRAVYEPGSEAVADRTTDQDAEARDTRAEESA